MSRVVCTTDSTAPNLNEGSHVLDRFLEYVYPTLSRSLFDDVKRAIDDALSHALLS